LLLEELLLLARQGLESLDIHPTDIDNYLGIIEGALAATGPAPPGSAPMWPSWRRYAGADGGLICNGSAAACRYTNGDWHVKIEYCRILQTELLIEP